MAIGLTVEDVDDNQMKYFELENSQDPLDGACDDNSEATLRPPNYDACGTAPIDVELVEIKEEREDVDAIKLESSLWDEPGTSDEAAMVCKSNVDNARPRGSCSTSTEEVTACSPVSRDGGWIDVQTATSIGHGPTHQSSSCLKATSVGHGPTHQSSSCLKATSIGHSLAHQSSSCLNKYVCSPMSSRKVFSHQTSNNSCLSVVIKCDDSKGQSTLGLRTYTQVLHSALSSQLSLEEVENTWGASFACKLCPYKTNMITYFKRHKQTHGKEAKPLSLYCKSSLKKASSFKPEVIALESNKKRQYACSQCSYKTKHKLLHDRHSCTRSKTQPRTKYYACAFCDLRCSNKSDLRKHLVVHDPKREKPFSCPDCEYKSDRKFAYRRHLHTHLSVREKPFACPVCPHKTDVKASLQKHIRSHDKERTRLFSCPHCTFTTDINACLQKHTLMHNSNRSKPFACQYCTFRTHDKRNLLMHIITHNPVEKDRLKNLACEYCSFRTSHRGHLNNHIRTHKNEYFACQHCSYKTKIERYLKDHLKRHKM